MPTPWGKEEESGNVRHKIHYKRYNRHKINNEKEKGCKKRINHNNMTSVLSQTFYLFKIYAIKLHSSNSRRP
jgi:hypothetical protein